MTSGKVVERGDFRAEFGQRSAKVRPDESGPAGDQYVIAAERIAVRDRQSMDIVRTLSMPIRRRATCVQNRPEAG